MEKQGSKGKGKNKRQQKPIEVKLADLDIKRHPILLKDGDHIGVRLLSGPTGTIEDDYQTEEDRVAGEEFRIMTEK